MEQRSSALCVAHSPHRSFMVLGKDECAPSSNPSVHLRGRGPPQSACQHTAGLGMADGQRQGSVSTDRDAKKEAGVCRNYSSHWYSTHTAALSTAGIALKTCSSR